MALPFLAHSFDPSAIIDVVVDAVVIIAFSNLRAMSKVRESRAHRAIYYKGACCLDSSLIAKTTRLECPILLVDVFEICLSPVHSSHNLLVLPCFYAHFDFVEAKKFCTRNEIHRNNTVLV